MTPVISTPGGKLCSGRGGGSPDNRRAGGGGEKSEDNGNDQKLLNLKHLRGGEARVQQALVLQVCRLHQPQDCCQKVMVEQVETTQRQVQEKTIFGAWQVESLVML